MRASPAACLYLFHVSTIFNSEERVMANNSSLSPFSSPRPFHPEENPTDLMAVLQSQMDCMCVSVCMRARCAVFLDAGLGEYEFTHKEVIVCGKTQLREKEIRQKKKWPVSALI